MALKYLSSWSSYLCRDCHVFIPKALVYFRRRNVCLSSHFTFFPRYQRSSRRGDGEGGWNKPQRTLILMFRESCTAQKSSKRKWMRSLNEVAVILLRRLNEEGGAASGLSQVHGEVTHSRTHSGGEGKGKRMPGALQPCSRQCPRPAGCHLPRFVRFARRFQGQRYKRMARQCN